jgi:prolyl-tRNA synthetase
VCTGCAYAANLEKAEIACESGPCAGECPDAAEPVPTPGAHTVDEVAGLLKIGPRKIVKTLLYAADGEPVAALVRGDRELNEVKLKNLLRARDLVLATPAQVSNWSGAPVGFAGPVGLNVPRVFADNELCAETDWVAGANRAEMHLIHVDLKRDAKVTAYADLRVIAETDPCPRCGKPIAFTRGIEVGHVFKLGTKYSEAMRAVFLDEQGVERPMIMGCYGIGVSRVVAACIEQNHDAAGIVFPPPVAPFEVAVLGLGKEGDTVSAAAEDLYNRLQRAGLEVLLDDRAERPGVKFKDADLCGFPIQVVIGAKGLEKGVAEVKDRKSGSKAELSLRDFEREFMLWREDVVWGGWGLGRGEVRR